MPAFWNSILLVTVLMGKVLDLHSGILIQLI